MFKDERFKDEIKLIKDLITGNIEAIEISQPPPGDWREERAMVTITVKKLTGENFIDEKLNELFYDVIDRNQRRE